MKSKVLVTQEQTKLDYLPAQRFGEIEFITRDEFSPVPTSLTNTFLMDTIKKAIKGFNPEDDYVVFSGSPLVAAAVFATIGAAGISAFRVLRWSNRDASYTPITINL